MKIKHHTVFILQNKHFKKHVNLLLLSNFKNSHYVFIKDFDGFMINKLSYHGNCLQRHHIAHSASLDENY